MATASSSSTTLEFLPRSYNVGGIDLNVWGMDRLSPDRKVAAMFFIHGRRSSKENLERHLRKTLDTLVCPPKPSHTRSKNLIIITLDARNHGTRVVDPDANETFEKNPRHAVDMYAIQTGTALDIAHLCNILPAYLFPESIETGGSPITTWICAGVSLGGHVSWLAGTKSPRISHLIPIIGGPNYTTLIQNRSAQQGVPFAAPYWPNSLGCLVRSCDPVHFPLDFWSGKRILAICGGQDRLVPPRESGTIDFVDELRAHGMGDRVQLKIDDSAGHEVTPLMIQWITEWIWENALKE